MPCDGAITSAQALQDDTNLLFGGILAAGRPTMSLTVFSTLSGLAVLPLIVASIGVTMDPNLSLRQLAQSVPQVLTVNGKAGPHAVDRPPAHAVIFASGLGCEKTQRRATQLLLD
jgi:hypothetical protein